MSKKHCTNIQKYFNIWIVITHKRAQFSQKKQMTGFWYSAFWLSAWPWPCKNLHLSAFDPSIPTKIHMGENAILKDFVAFFLYGDLCRKFATFSQQIWKVKVCHGKVNNWDYWSNNLGKTQQVALGKNLENYDFGLTTNKCNKCDFASSYALRIHLKMHSALQ